MVDLLVKGLGQDRRERSICGRCYHFMGAWCVGFDHLIISMQIYVLSPDENCICPGLRSTSLKHIGRHARAMQVIVPVYRIHISRWRSHRTSTHAFDLSRVLRDLIVRIFEDWAGD
jgi:hypothetical protein